MCSFKIYGIWSQASKHTHKCVQCSHASVGLAQAHPKWPTHSLSEATYDDAYSFQLSSRFTSVRDHVNSIFWWKSMNAKNRIVRAFRPTFTFMCPLVKELAVSTQNYFKIKSHSVVISKSVE